MKIHEIFTAWWFWVILALVIFALIYFLFLRKKKTPAKPANTTPSTPPPNTGGTGGTLTSQQQIDNIRKQYGELSSILSGLDSSALAKAIVSFPSIVLGDTIDTLNAAKAVTGGWTKSDDEIFNIYKSIGYPIDNSSLAKYLDTIQYQNQQIAAFLSV